MQLEIINTTEESSGRKFSRAAVLQQLINTMNGDERTSRTGRFLDIQI